MFAQAGERYTLAAHAAADRALYVGVVVRRGEGEVEIYHPVAVGADKMRMGVDIAVEALLSRDGADADDVAVPAEEGEIAVHGSQAEVGEERLELRIDPFGRGVLFGGAHHIEDGLTFFAVIPAVGFHGFTLIIMRIVIIFSTLINLSHAGGFVNTKTVIIIIIFL